MIQIDIGILIVGIIAGIVGAIVQFWQKTINEELTTQAFGLKPLIDELRSEVDEKVISPLKLLTKSQRKGIIKNFLKSKVKGIMKKHNISWSLSLFFGIVAALLYLLISPIDNLVNGFDKAFARFIIGSFSAGYAGESFIYNILREENPFEEFTMDDLTNFVNESD